jgi:RNA polymerase sigma-B factor
LKELRAQLGAAREELTQENGRAPTATEIADYLHIERESATDATIADAGYSACSIDVLARALLASPVVLPPDLVVVTVIPSQK